ncbi:hypothetical protein M0R19_02885 [Candidatus Pacearchaeota archaeon]|nr:hypothetical protein [Candidatus Pacearchaeota archaeon]
MVNYEILEGLKIALERGESLKKATTTFLNSGYRQEEVEEAARIISEASNKDIPEPKNISASSNKKSSKLNLRSFMVHKTSAQKVSSYGEPELPEVELLSIPTPIAKEKKEGERLLQEEKKELLVPKKLFHKEEEITPKLTVQEPKQIKEESIQKISNYEIPKEKSNKNILLILVLIAILFVLSGFLLITILNREALIIFFSKLLSQ